MAPPSKPTCDAATWIATALALVVAAAPATARAGDGTPVAITSTDPAAKREAQAMVTDGVKLLQAKQYQAALDKFEDAYARYPSPKILLDVGSTLRDMGRVAEAANAYARYLDDPGPGAERVAEVRQLLDALDRRVGIVVVDVTPAGAEISIDGGAWTTIGARSSTRIAVGAHRVRARKDALAPAEVTVQAIAGQRTSIAIALRPPPAIRDAAAEPVPAFMEEPTAAPSIEAATDAAAPRATDAPADAHVELSLQARLDGKGRGGAVAIGAAVDPWQALQLEAALLLSQDGDRNLVYGAYAGTRVRLLTGRLRPVIGAGAPIFWSDGVARIGVRAGAGVELLITDHLGVLADVGVEHFFNSQPGYETDVLVPIVGVQGRM